MVECLDTYYGLTLDFKYVSGYNMKSIQLLHSALITAENAGKRFAITNASDEAVAAVARVG